MKLLVVSHKPCWLSPTSPTGYATDGGFPFQMRALSELFDSTTLLLPYTPSASRVGEIPLHGHNVSIATATAPVGRGLTRKLGMALWPVRNLPVIVREIIKADVVHTPIPGDIGTVGMLLAFVLRKRLFVRHCGNWLRPVTTAEHFWKWFMEKFAGGRQVMLATGGGKEPPSRRNDAVRWIFSTTLTEEELSSTQGPSGLGSSTGPKLIIVCRQDPEKGTGIVIQSLPLIIKAFPNATLDVVGDGEALEEFKRLAESLDLSDRVVFCGKVDHAGVVKLLMGADLFCYPTSASEGFPKVVLEALAFGLPVVTTRVSVLPQLIGAGGGCLIDSTTPEAVADAVIGIMSDRERYRAISALAIETARRYSLERWRDTIGEQLRSAWGDLVPQTLEPLRADD
jgi:glycosyltransferase involved in cell wall biosynthesis